MAEAYGLTQNSSLKPLLEESVDIIINGQSNGGGWYYSYGNKEGQYGDMSISGWQIQALETAYLTGIKQSEITATLEKATKFVKNMYFSNSSTSKGAFGYQNPQLHWTLTGTGLLSLIYLNQRNSNEANGSVNFISDDVIFGINNNIANVGGNYGGKVGDKWTGSDTIYAYYYITQALFLYDGPHGPNWNNWNKQFNDPQTRVLIKTQNSDGSFSHNDWVKGNLVYSTTLCTLMLEAYYRNSFSSKP